MGHFKFLEFFALDYRQEICVAIGIFPFWMVAMFTTWASPSLAILHSAESPLGRFTTEEEGAWIVSSYFLGVIPGGIFGGFFLNRIGRRNVLLCCAFLLSPPWILIAFPIDVYVIYLGRFLAGLAGSVSVFAAVVYCNEIIPMGRGMERLESFMVSYQMIGTSFILLINPYISYHLLAVICAVQPIIFFCLLLLLPESPYFLMMKGNFRGAQNSMDQVASVRLSEYITVSPLKNLEMKINYDLDHKITTKEFLLGPKYRNTLIVVAAMKILQQCSGWTAISAYMPDIINLTTSLFHWQASSVIFGGLLIPAVIIAGPLINEFNRKPVIAISTLAAGLALAFEGLYFYAQDYIQMDTAQLAWLPTTGIAAFLVFFHLGIGSELTIACSELFPPNIRIMMLSVTTAFSGCTAFIILRIYKMMSRVFGVHVIMWFFATQCLLGAVFVVVFLPETKGKRKVSEIRSCIYASVDIDDENDKGPVLSIITPDDNKQHYKKHNKK